MSRLARQPLADLPQNYSHRSRSWLKPCWRIRSSQASWATSCLAKASNSPAAINAMQDANRLFRLRQQENSSLRVAQANAFRTAMLIQTARPADQLNGGMIRAPYDGIVSKLKLGKAGEILAAGQRLMDIVPTGPSNMIGPPTMAKSSSTTAPATTAASLPNWPPVLPV